MAIVKEDKRPSPIPTTAILILLLWLAFALRLYNLDAFSFWTDEGLTPLRSGYPIAEILSNRIIIQEGITKDTHPPLFYLIIHGTRQLFGESDFAFRYPSALAGVLLLPLLYQFGRRLDGRALGLLATLLLAINPLQVWYAKEARMYTIFMLLAAAATYQLWRVLTRPNFWRPLLLYVLFASLTVYTHYTAVFLFAAQSLFLVWLLWQRGHKKLILSMGLFAILVAIPVIPFTVPRLFTGAEANYYYVSPQTMLQDVVHFFGLGVTVDFQQLWVKLLDVAALLLLIAGVAAARSWRLRLFLLTYLLAVVFGLMAGSLLKPMYQGVRHIMAGSPAFVLLLAWGGVGVGRRASGVGRWVAVGMVTAVLLVGPLLSLHNLFFDPTYAKDDFRALARYIDLHAGRNDLVIYNDAVLLPLHQHYQQRPDVAATALPIYPYMATGQEPELAQFAQTYNRIWFITNPPADKRDDDHLIQQWLQTNLSQVDSFAAHARTTVVGLYAFSAAPAMASALPPDAMALYGQWPDLPPLTGIALDFTQPAALPTLWFDLFWQGGPAPDPATHLRFSLRGADDREWVVQGTLLNHEQPWPAVGLARRSYQLPLPAGTPPGEYTLWLQPLTAAAGNAIGDDQLLAPITLAAENAWPVAGAQLFTERPFTTPFPLHFDNGLSLVGLTMPEAKVRPGHNLPLTLYWMARQPLPTAGLRYQLEVIGPDGAQLRWQTDPPSARWLAEWPVATLLREQTGLYFHPETEPGRYTLQWRVFVNDEAIPGRPAWRPWRSDALRLGTVQVQPWPLITTLPTADVELTEATFGDLAQLYGFHLEAIDNNLQVTLYWQVQTPPDSNYFAFVHLVAADGTIIAQVDQTPVNGLRPTKGWRAGEVLTDVYTLPNPDNLPSGAYTLNVGLYQPDTFQRLPVIYQGERQPNDQMRLIIMDTRPSP